MKDYYCKDCPQNNNGWCKLHKRQGLKDIGYCADRPNNESIETVKIRDTKGADKQFGKREMFYHIQSQMLAIDEDENEENKFKILKQVMVNLEKVLLMEEQIHGISIDYELDRDIVESSKRISEHWLNTVGEYKGN